VSPGVEPGTEARAGDQAIGGSCVAAMTWLPATGVPGHCLNVDVKDLHPAVLFLPGWRSLIVVAPH
jgi:hypothetical protein